VRHIIQVSQKSQLGHLSLEMVCWMPSNQIFKKEVVMLPWASQGVAYLLRSSVISVIFKYYWGNACFRC
jgi:hypothetical protein